VIHNNRLYVTGSLQIVAYDLTGLANLPPTVVISTVNNEVKYVSPAKIKMTATVSNQDATINKVQFYADSIPLKTDKKVPYNFSWNNVPPGKYTLTAKATNSKGISGSSAPLIVEVTEEVGAAVASHSHFKGTLTAEAPTELVSITVSPNPARGILVIQSNIERNRPSSISIISFSGAVVQTLRSKTTQEIIYVDLSNLTTGVYTVKIDSGNKTYYSKFIKL